MKITTQPERAIAAVSLRSACDMSRACSPGRESPMSPSSSARGTSAATESMTITSTALERTSQAGGRGHGPRAGIHARDEEHAERHERDDHPPDHRHTKRVREQQVEQDRDADV